MASESAPPWFKESIKEVVNDAINDSIKASLVEVLGLRAGQSTNLPEILTNTLQPIRNDIRTILNDALQPIKNDIRTIKDALQPIKNDLAIAKYQSAMVYNHTFVIFHTDPLGLFPLSCSQTRTARILQKNRINFHRSPPFRPSRTSQIMMSKHILIGTEERHEDMLELSKISVRQY
ncbi:hypothetical protein F5887DRAFT_1003451 [Amanita rubescens]|nr:hypothetical protein F5887DRAFT_1003451 [Amanita rubescens]